MLLKNPAGGMPTVCDTAYVSESAVIIGNVEIKGDVYIAPNTTIRADEPGSAIIIESGCNIQDNVVIHALGGSTVVAGENTSMAHGCIVHGPCTFGNNCFIGFGSVVFNCTLGDDCVILHRTLVKDVIISPRRLIEDGAVVNKQGIADYLGEVTVEISDFVKRVVGTNLMLVKSYSELRLLG
ncbi:MAG: carbonate dehydratase [Candidatus Methanoperedens sp.]|nr:carbonate dehydratase [Candidatus Methanoperedens sp.]